MNPMHVEMKPKITMYSMRPVSKKLLMMEAMGSWLKYKINSGVVNIHGAKQLAINVFNKDGHTEGSAFDRVSMP